jgi:hypothetical protein
VRAASRSCSAVDWAANISRASSWATGGSPARGVRRRAGASRPRSALFGGMGGERRTNGGHGEPGAPIGVPGGRACRASVGSSSLGGSPSAVRRSMIAPWMARGGLSSSPVAYSGTFRRTGSPCRSWGRRFEQAGRDGRTERLGERLITTGRAQARRRRPGPRAEGSTENRRPGHRRPASSARWATAAGEGSNG